MDVNPTVTELSAKHLFDRVCEVTKQWHEEQAKVAALTAALETIRETAVLSDDGATIRFIDAALDAAGGP